MTCGIILKLKRFARIAFNFCFSGVECVSCGKRNYEGVLCGKCAKKYLYDAVGSFGLKKRCSFCSRVLLSEENICMRCRTDRIIRSDGKVLSVLPYRLWMKDMLFLWKQQNRRELSFVFAKVLHLFIEKFFSESGYVVVPVPPRPGKIKKKGWDQVDEVCNFLRFFSDVKVMKLLERTSDVQQKKLGREERLHRGENIFVPSKYGLKKLRNAEIPEKVILIDDIVTTGATLQSCFEVLRKLGCIKVEILTLFMVD